jgi:hypothetical protein
VKVLTLIFILKTVAMGCTDRKFPPIASSSCFFVDILSFWTGAMFCNKGRISKNARLSLKINTIKTLFQKTTTNFGVFERAHLGG